MFSPTYILCEIMKKAYSNCSKEKYQLHLKGGSNFKKGQTANAPEPHVCHSIGEHLI